MKQSPAGKQTTVKITNLCVEANIARGEAYDNTGPIRPACGAPVSYKENKRSYSYSQLYQRLRYFSPRLLEGLIYSYLF